MEISVGGSAELGKWCCNALRRNGFRITDGGHCRVVVVSPDNIELDMPGEHLAFKSVEELIVYLLDAKNKAELWK